MSNKDQAVKNMDLSQELAEFIAKNPKAVKKIPRSSTFVAFSSKDEQLNKANEKLIASLMQEGKKVIKAIQTNDKFNPWKFFPVASI
ncbi:MAG TPA: DUF5647 family protein [Patescibacteria group bacterium]|nr:DUF5647 family protein [Patescibacteria group bacterium]